MNQALRMPELLDLICTQVNRRTNLARLARTSRIWFSPSVTRLWRDDIEFQHILALIPGTTSDGNASLTNETFPEELTPPMFDRLHLYAPKITHVIAFLYGSNRGPPPQEQVRAINTILQYTPGRVMFPQLRSLTVYTSRDVTPFFHGITWLFLLLSPSIIKFSIPNVPIHRAQETQIRYHVLEVFLGLVLETCSNLDTLALSLLPRALSDLENNSEADYSGLVPHPHLRSLWLNLDICNAALFDWFSHFPRLQGLSISGDSTYASLPQHLTAHAPPNSFPVLSKIDCYGFGLESISNLWRSAIVRNLTKAYIEFPDGLSNREAASMLSLIATYTPNLHSLTLSSGYINEPDPKLPLHILRSLPLVHLAISGLQGCKLDSGGGLEDLSRYWPMLESLELDTFTVSYQDLLRVSLIFPNLRKLDLCLPSDPPVIDIDIPSRPLTTSWPNHRLEFTASDGPSFPKNTRSQLEDLGLLLAMVWPNMGFGADYPRDVDFWSIIPLVCDSIKRNSARILRQAQE